MKVKLKKRIIKFFCNFIPIPGIRRKVRTRLLKVDMIFPYKIKPVFEDVQSPIISVIIPVYNQWKVTYECLKSMAYYKPEVPFEIIIADDGSTDKTFDIEKNIPGIKVLKTPGGLGFLNNVQNAVPHARGKYIFLMNNDMMVTENWLDSSYNLIKEDKTLGIVGSLNLSPNGEIQEFGIAIDTSGYVHFSKVKEEDIDSLTPIETDYCSGCSILFLKSDWDRLGGFDEQFSPAYCEDSDFCLRVRFTLGKRVICNPKSKIYHYRNLTYSDKARIYAEKNRIKFIKKWEKELAELNKNRKFGK